MTNDRGRPYSVYSGGAPGTSTPPALSRLRAIRAASSPASDRAQVHEALPGARILLFPSRPTGTAYRLLLSRDYPVDAIRDGEVCPTCGASDWRLTPPGLWLCRCGSYWSPWRLAAKPHAGTVPPVEIETRRPA